MSSIFLLFFRRKFICPFAHKAGPHENFVKGMDKTGRGSEYARNKFTNVCDAKIKEDIQGVPRVKVTTSGECSLC
jgi:hypothetical protein